MAPAQAGRRAADRRSDVRGAWRGGQARSDARIREPSEISEAEVTTQFVRARQAAASAGMLLDPEVQARIARPPAEAIALCAALARALTLAGYARTPEAAADVMLDAIRKFQTTMVIKDA